MLRVGGLGFVPTLPRRLDVALKEFGQIVVAEELVLVRDPGEDGGRGRTHTGWPLPVRTATTDTWGALATVMVSSTHRK